jgi:hypothetical protein
MIKWLTKRWEDPVWSKVYAWAICGSIAFIGLVAYALITDKSFVAIVIEWLTFKISVWIVLVLVVLIWGLYAAFKSKKETAFAISPLPVESKKGEAALSSSHLNVLVDLNNIGDYDIELERIKGIIEGKETGELAQGSYEIKDGILNIIRTNTEGIFLLRIIQYNIDNERTSYIKSNSNIEGDRRLLVTFKAKVIGGSHSFRVICKKFFVDQWVDKANYRFIIQNETYQGFAREIKLKANEDFRIQMDDIEVENPNSSIQIKDFKVIEIL